MHALVYRVSNQPSDAVSSGRAAVRRLRQKGDAQRYVSAVMAQAHSEMNLHQYRPALELMVDTYRIHGNDVSGDTHARLLANIAHCHRMLRDFTSAVNTYRTAAVLFDELSVTTEAARTRMNLAIVLSEAGNSDQAAKEIHAVRETFGSLGMGSEVALSDLILAEIALSRGDYDEVRILCSKAIQFFERAGVPYGTRALTALAYLSEAAREKRLTAEAVRHVGTYIRALPSRPNLLFAPPPD